MPGAIQQSELHVEGADDKWSIINLLIRHGIDFDDVNGNPPRVIDSGGVDRLLDGVRTAVKVSGGRNVGFVLDSDSPLTDRWRAVVSRLNQVDVSAPPSPPPEGFIAHSDTYNARVGVWLMPDNQQDGTLENMLETLIADDDALIDAARDAVDHAKILGAEFKDSDTINAVLHTWLAWQEEPGRPVGVAIRAHYFQRHDGPTALAFADWFKNCIRSNSAPGSHAC